MAKQTTRGLPLKNSLDLSSVSLRFNFPAFQNYSLLLSLQRNVGLKWKAMEAETHRSNRPPSAKIRKPLSDSTNLVIPTSTILRNLSSSLSSPPPKPNPNAKSKPYNYTPNKPVTNSSQSETSIGSSNYNDNNVKNPRPVSQPGNEGEKLFEHGVVYSRRRSAEKTKDKGKKAVAVPFTCPPHRREKDNAKADTGIITCPPQQKTKDKGKVDVVPFTLNLVEKTRDRRKAVDVPPSFPPPVKENYNRKDVSVPISCRALLNIRNKRKAIAEPSSCPPLPRTRNMRNEFNDVGDVDLSESHTVPRPKHKKKKCCLLPKQDVSKNPLPQEFIEQQRAYFKEVDEFELPEEEISENEFYREESDAGKKSRK